MSGHIDRSSDALFEEWIKADTKETLEEYAARKESQLATESLDLSNAPGTVIRLDFRSVNEIMKATYNPPPIVPPRPPEVIAAVKQIAADNAELDAMVRDRYPRAVIL